MPLSILPDLEDLQQETNPQDEQTKIIQQIENDPQLSRDFARFENNQLINYELAEEILALLREVEATNYDSVDNQKYINWETEPIAYDVLRKAGESEPARLIKNKRRLELHQWGRIPVGNNVERGFKLIFNNPDYQPTKEEKALLSKWERTIVDNFFFPPNEPYANFGKFLGACYDDFFDLDDLTWEIRRDRMNRPVAIHLQDALIWKPIVKNPKFSGGISYRQGDEISELLKNYETIFNIKAEQNSFEQPNPDYVLVYQGQKIAVATRNYLRKHHFFVKSRFQRAQRGYSIVEQGLRMITYISNALKMNASNFTNTRLPLGFFLFSGGVINQTHLEKLKKIMYANLHGSTNQSKFPMMSVQGERGDAKWIGVRNASRDAEYHQFMTLLFSIYCQLSGTDPRELALGSYGDAVGKRSLFEESSDGLIKESKDAGLKSFLQHVEDSINAPNEHGQNLMQEITRMDVRGQFIGFQVEDKKQKLELNSKRISTDASINDLLKESDQERQELMLGDVNIYDIKGLANPQIFQSILFNAQQKAQQQQQAQAGGMPMQAGAPPQGAEAGQQEEKGQGQSKAEQPEAEQKNTQGKLTDRDKALLDRYRDIAVPEEELEEQ